MIRLRRAAFGMIFVLAAGHAKAEEPLVTSDTPEYCGVLLERIHVLLHQTAVPPSPEAVALSAAGDRMCGQGHFRGGITRLRRALALLRQAEN